MKIIVTHMRPDLDALGAVWSIKRFAPGWEDVSVSFVPAGSRLPNTDPTNHPIEQVGENEVIHVDTGMGPLDHHQTSDITTCAAKRAWQWAMQQKKESIAHGDTMSDHLRHEIAAGSRLMEIICEIDHFREVFWPDPASDRYDITLSRILDGLKLSDNDDNKLIETGILLFDALYRAFQNKVWAEEEIKQKGVPFETRWGKGLAVETVNDDVVHLAQLMGYRIALRKDPRKGYVRLKARPSKEGEDDIDLTPAYVALQKADPQATWFLHVSKHMLLNGTAKNPKMKPSKLKLDEIIKILESL